MTEEKMIYNKLIKISALLYALEAALDTDTQQTKDTSPYAYFAKLIRNKLCDLIESVQS